MTDYLNAVWIPNNNFFQSTGKKKYLVIHGTAGGNSAKGVAEYFKETEGTINPVSSNYIVDQAGTVVQCVLEKDGAWAQGVVNNPAFQEENPNDYSISIEFVKSSTDNSDLLTDAQKIAGIALIKDICKRNSFTYGNIIPHALIDPVNRARCPGPFPWDDVQAALEGIIMDADVQKAALNQWGSILKLSNGGIPPTGTGIYNAWLADYEKGVFHGPPVSHEENTVNWQGKPIIIQYFLFDWIEWDNGIAGWYSKGGKE